jgi:hypothetical protein
MRIKFYRCACSEKDGERFTSCHGHRDDLSPRDPSHEVRVDGFVVPPPGVQDPNAPPNPDPIQDAAKRVTSLISALRSADPQRKAHAEALATHHGLTFDGL